MTNTHSAAKRLSGIEANIRSTSQSLSSIKNNDTPVPAVLGAVYEPGARYRAWKLYHGFDPRYANPSLADCRKHAEWRESHNAATSIINLGGMVCLIGNRGTGKTQMAYYLVKDFFRLNDISWPYGRTKHAAYGTALNFFMTIKSTYNNSDINEQDVLAVLSRIPIMVIDEMQVRGDTEWENSMLTHLIDSRYGKMLGTILISNQSTRAFVESVGPSIADRIRETGGIIAMDWGSLRG